MTKAELRGGGPGWGRYFSDDLLLRHGMALRQPAASYYRKHRGGGGLSLMHMQQVTDETDWASWADYILVRRGWGGGGSYRNALKDGVEIAYIYNSTSKK